MINQIESTSGDVAYFNFGFTDHTRTNYNLGGKASVTASFDPARVSESVLGY